MKTIQQTKIDNLIEDINSGRSSSRSIDYNNGKIAGLIHAKKIYESELIPVMEEMKEALLESEFFMRERNSMFSHSYDKVHKALSKYNELFKK